MLIRLFSACLAAFILAGCGGAADSAARTSRAAVRIEWPGPGRLIPAASNFIRVRAVTLSGQPIGTTPPAVQRPLVGSNQTSEIVIDDLPVGQAVIIRAEAFPDAALDSTGKKAQARGDVMLHIRNDAPNTFDISMASTVRSLNVQLLRNGQPMTPPYQFESGDLIQAAVQARDGDGDAVLITTSNLQWSRSGGAGVLLNGDDEASGPDCRMRCNDAVTCAVILTETESGVSTQFNVSVTRPIYPGAVDTFLGGGAGIFEPFPASPLNGDLVTTADPSGATIIIVLDTVFNPGRVVTYSPGNLVPLSEFNLISPAAPNYSERLTRNTSGLCFASYPVANTVRNMTFAGGLLAVSPVAFTGVKDLDAHGGFTYVLDTAPGGFRVLKLRDSDLALISQFYLPVGFNARHISVDDEASVYVMGRESGSPKVVKLDRNGVPLPFDVPAGTIQSAGDIDVDINRGLLYVMDYAAGSVQVLGLGGAFVQTVPHPDFIGVPYDIGIWPALSGHNGRFYIHGLRQEYTGGDPPQDYLRQLLFVPG